MFNVVVLALRFVVLAALYLFLAYVLVTLSRDVVRAGRASRAPAAAARLQAVGGPGAPAGTRFSLSDVAVIGRAPQAEIHVDDAFASERNARITRTPSGFVLEDLGSTNGTLFGERRLSETVLLSDGDEFTVGQTTLRFEALL